MPDIWDTPFDANMEVVDNYDTKVLQLEIKGTTTEENKNGKPTKTTYIYVELDRDLADAGGKEWVNDILKQEVNGRLYKKLWKYYQEWTDGLAEKLRNIEDMDKYQSKGEDGYEPLLHAWEIWCSMLRDECVRALSFRHVVQRTGDRDHFFAQELYPSTVKMTRALLTVRSLAIYANKFFTEGGHQRAECLQNVRRELEDLPWIVEPGEVEVVNVQVGAFCPEAIPKEEMQEQFNSIDGDHPKKNTREWLRMAASLCISYGLRAPLEERQFLHQDDAYEWAKQMLGETRIMLGFKLDRNVSAVASGWDWLRGDCTGRKR
jgi:hypothetical protein